MWGTRLSCAEDRATFSNLFPQTIQIHIFIVIFGYNMKNTLEKNTAAV